MRMRIHRHSLSCVLMHMALLLNVSPCQSFQSQHFASTRNILGPNPDSARRIEYPLLYSHAQPLGHSSNRRKIRQKKNNRKNKGNNYTKDQALKKSKNKDGIISSLHTDEDTDRQSMQRMASQQSLHRYNYMYDTTMALLDTDVYPVGSLGKGKWHEMKSILVAWSKWMNSDAYKLAIHASNDKDALSDPIQLPILVESILKRIIDERSAGNSDVQVTAQMYNVILEVWMASIANAKSVKSNGPLSIIAAQRSLDIVKQMQCEYEETGDELMKPNFFSFLIVLKQWIKASALTSIPRSKETTPSHKASRKAHQMIRWMEQLAKTGENAEAKPNVLLYTLVMDSYAKSGERDAGSKAEALIREMQNNEDNYIQPNLFCYNMVINAYSNQGQREGAVDNAERILHELENIHEETGDESMKPDVITYTSLITAWAHSNRRGYGANRAEEILIRMMEAGCEPNTVTFNAVLKAWCKSGERDAAERALNIFKQMEDECRRGNKNVEPDRITYNTLIHTLTKSGMTDAMHHAERILAQMETQSDNGSKHLFPNLFSYNIMIEGWSKVRDSDGALKAHAILQKLLTMEREGGNTRPDLFSFNHVILASSRSGLKSSALRAEELLQYMLKEYKGGNTRLKPDVFGYSAAIHAWATSGDSEAGLHAEALLDQMEDMYNAGEKNLKPNTSEFEKCSILFLLYCNAPVTNTQFFAPFITVTFNSCIDCWAKSRQAVFGARKAEQLLERMEAMFSAGDESVKPTAHTYTSVLHAWANSNTKCAHLKSQALLNHMWKQYEKGNNDMKPDAFAYNTVINAVSKSHREDKAQRALRILRTMDKLYRAGVNKGLRPNEFTYTSVLNSCAFSCGRQHTRRKALDTAIFTLEELQESPYGNPNHVTYGMFLKACANLIPMDAERRRVVVEPVFMQCCKDGQVGEIVLKQLRLAAPDDLYQKLLGDLSQSGSTVRIEDLPVEWRCNVRNEKHRKRRKYRKTRDSKYKIAPTP